MELAELQAASIKQAKQDLKAMVLNQVALAFDPAMQLAADKLKVAIPGQVDDAVIDVVMASLLPIGHKELVAQVEKLLE